MMRLFRTLGSELALLLLASTASAGALAPDARAPADPLPSRWHAYESAPGRFRLLLPEAPRVTYSSEPTIVGPIHQARYALEVGTTRMQVEHHDLPRLATLILSSRAILGRAADGLVEDERARELERAELAWQGHPALVLRYEIPGVDPLVERALLVLVERRLYIVLAAWPAEATEGEEVARLFGSFEVVRP
jgi:hypothetical protein